MKRKLLSPQNFGAQLRKKFVESKAIVNMQKFSVLVLEILGHIARYRLAQLAIHHELDTFQRHPSDREFELLFLGRHSKSGRISKICRNTF